jgi:gamma-glutamylcyclotransferase (GGCT)/AIG2-like uncharacterized protein YtfP
MKAITGKTYPGKKASLPGYAVYRVKEAAYPGAIHSPDNETQGILYSGIPDEQLKVLDLFEGKLYERQYSDIRTEDGKSQKAWVYVVSESKKNHLTTEPWHLDTFVENDLDIWMNDED